MQKNIRIEPGLIITPLNCLQDGCVIVNERATIQYVGHKKHAPEGSKTIQAPNMWLIPGLIDIHVHGGNGIAFGIGEDLEQDLETYSQWIIKSGVTAFLCSVAAPDHAQTCTMLEKYVPILETGTTGAKALGLHLEGPYLNPKRKGAFNPTWLRNPTIKEARDYIQIAGKWIKQISMAPELPNAHETAAEFCQAGIKVALGHSDTDYDTALEALRGDFTHVTHTFNAQSGFHHRSPGVVGAILSSDDITAELIADGMHIHPGAMRVLVRALGNQRVVLITDAIMCTGLPNGTYRSIGESVFVNDSQPFLEDGTLAGGAAMFIQCVRNMHQMVGVSLQDAVRMASLNPAMVIGFQDQIGSLRSGKRADLVLLDQDFNIKMVMVEGKILINDL